MIQFWVCFNIWFAAFGLVSGGYGFAALHFTLAFVMFYGHHRTVRRQQEMDQLSSKESK